MLLSQWSIVAISPYIKRVGIRVLLKTRVKTHYFLSSILYHHQSLYRLIIIGMRDCDYRWLAILYFKSLGHGNKRERELSILSIRLIALETESRAPCSNARANNFKKYVWRESILIKT